MYLRSNDLAVDSDDRLDARLATRVPRSRDPARPLQRLDHLSGVDRLDGPERAVRHEHARAAGSTELRAEVVAPVARVLAVAELEVVTAGKHPRGLLLVVLGPGVDDGEDALGADDGLLKLLHGAAQVERPAGALPLLDREGVVLLDLSLALHDDLRHGVHEQHERLARAGSARAEYLLIGERVERLAPSAGLVDGVSCGVAHEFTTQLILISAVGATSITMVKKPAPTVTHFFRAVRSLVAISANAMDLSESTMALVVTTSDV